MNKRPKRLVKSKSTLRSFTYYIPAPPHRKSGYREKEFDKILSGILESGFELVELKTQAVGNDNGAGLFVIALLKAKSSAVSALDKDFEIQERFKLRDSHSSPDIILEEDDFGDDL